MNIGISVLIAVSILIFLGFGHRALDRLQLTDKTALLILVGMLVGGFLPELSFFNDFGINIGGGLIPLALVVYLLVKAEAWERGRSIIASLLTAFIIYGLMKILPVEPTYNMALDPLFVIALTAGVMGYIFGRSRRGAFIAAVMGVILNDIFAFTENMAAGAPAPIVIGGAGVFDAIVLAGILSLGMVEVFGETLERITLAGKYRKMEEENRNKDNTEGDEKND